MSDVQLISIIIPTLNEAELLPSTLESISKNIGSKEIIVVDSGSTDKTVELAAQGGATVIASSVKQRAAQMNLGAKHANGDVFLFLHADTRIAPDALSNLAKALSHPENVGGAFHRQFDHPSLFLKLTCCLAGWRSRLLAWFFGDQGIFVRNEIFHRLGGFPEIDLFEDLEFSRRLARSGRVVTLPPPVVSSGRRFGRNPVHRTLKDMQLTWRYFRNRQANG